jgi:hypothetical protein
MVTHLQGQAQRQHRHNRIFGEEAYKMNRKRIFPGIVQLKIYKSLKQTQKQND